MDGTPIPPRRHLDATSTTPRRFAGDGERLIMLLDRSIYPPSVRDGGSPPSYLGRAPTIPPQPHRLALQPGAHKVNSHPHGLGQPQVDTTTRSTYTSSTHAHPDHPPTHPDRPRRRLDHPPKHPDPLRIHPDSWSLRAYLTLHPDSGELRSL